MVTLLKKRFRIYAEAIMFFYYVRMEQRSKFSGGLTVGRLRLYHRIKSPRNYVFSSIQANVIEYTAHEDILVKTV